MELQRAGGVWETQGAASLQVFSFQFSVFSESFALFMVSAHGDPTRLEACFETSRRCEVDTEG